MAEETTKIKLKDVKVIFYNEEDSGFGRSITIDATDEAIKKQITEWVERNKIGKDEPGVPKFKEYTNEKTGETTVQFAFKINDYTKYAGINGLGQKDIAYGSHIDLIANSFEYSNKFTGGKTRVGQSVSAIVVRTAGVTGNDEDLANLLSEFGDEASEESDGETVSASSIPFN